LLPDAPELLVAAEELIDVRLSSAARRARR
jgi:hypothetical protein